MLSTAGRAKFRAGFCSSVLCRFTRFPISNSASDAGTFVTSRFLLFSCAAVVVVVVVVPVFVVVVAVFVVVDAVLVAPSTVVV